MRILFLNYEYPPLGGGAANATKYLLQEYAKRKNISVDLVTTAADNRERVEDIGGDVRIHYISVNKNQSALTHQSARDLLMYSWKGYRRARDLMRSGSYDVIHAFFGVPCGTMARYLSKKFHVPYIVSLRGADVPGFSDRYTKIYPLLSPQIKAVWKDAAAVIANSRQLRDLAHETDSEQEIDIIYNGVDTKFFSARDDSFADIFVVLTAARLMRRKGIKFAIDAFAKLRDRHPEIHSKMIIAGGDGDAADELRDQVRQKNLSQDVLFVGHLSHDELVVAYHDADVFVLPSFNEGMSNNMLEALACGLPVVITRTGGSEILTDGKEGFLVDRESSDDIYNALVTLAKDRNRAHEMRLASRTLAEKMSWKSVADQYEELYYKHYRKLR